MQTRRQGYELVPFDPEIEAIARRLNSRQRRRRNKRREDLTMAETPEKLLLDYITPDASIVTTSIVRPEIFGNQYEIRSAFFNWIAQDQFHGMENENPTDHINLFIDKCMTHKYNNITSDQLMLIAFPFSLAGAAKQWLREEEPNSIATWEALKKQKDGESIYDAWERFKSLIRKCPDHGLPDWMVIETVYNALRHEIQTSLDAAGGGNFMMKTLTQAKKILDDMASNYHLREQSTPKRGGRYEVDAIVALTNNVQALTRKVEQLVVAAVNKVCGACGLNGHSSVDCQQQVEGAAAVEQVNAIQNQNARQQYNPYSNTFNPGWRDHPNFSYRNNNAQNPSSSYNIPSGFQQRPPFPPQQQHPPKSNLESLMENFIANQSKQNEHFSTSINQILAHKKMIDTQMAQIAQQLSNLSMQKGQLPGNTEKRTQPHLPINNSMQ
ncbi:uncharacterized protein LOC130799406 [Amaranthus tricolor]|uniref:uncharacterized protein LOC130799406 n=1 Tax=Amaranthus tricolor TaxID=29722 RepID=UPI00258F9A5A|nr:uncharacterized protein LOC130799406 [Amaranthus tricolor]